VSQVVLAPGGKDPGFSVTAATIRMSRAGAWTADVTAEAEQVPTGAVELRLGGGRVLKGTVSRGAVFGGMLRVRLVAGANGLRKVLEPRHFTTPSVRVVLSEILRQTGEILSPAADASFLGTVLEHWTIWRGPAGDAIERLFDRLPATARWRILDDGTLWVGAEAWPASGITGFTEISRSPEDEVVNYALEIPYLQPGTMLGAEKVDACEIVISAAKARATVWTVP
jgi:hypothetical protein